MYLKYFINRSNFHVLFKIHNFTASCGSAVIASNSINEIQTPGYPDLLYKGELNCTWTISSQVKGSKIYLVFTTLETTRGKDSLKVQLLLFIIVDAYAQNIQDCTLL